MEIKIIPSDVLDEIIAASKERLRIEEGNKNRSVFDPGEVMKWRRIVKTLEDIKKGKK